MRFRIFLAVVSIFMASCDKFLPTKKTEKTVLEVAAVELSCLDSAVNGFKRITRSEMKPNDWNEVTTCLKTAVRSFKDKTEGEQKQVYSYQELMRFFNRYYLKNNPISDSLGFGLMQLKKGLFGGDDKVITFQELDFIVNWLKKLEEPLRQVEPHLSVMLMNKDTTVGTRPSESELQLAIQKVEVFLIDVLRSTQLWHSQYQFEQGSFLIQDIGHFMKKYVSEENAELLPLRLSLIPLVSNIFIKERPLLTLNDYQSAIKTFVRLYGIWIQNHYLRQNAQLIHTLKDLNITSDLSLQLLAILEESPAMMSHNQIDLQDIQKFIEKALDPKLKFLEKTIDPQAAFEAFKMMLGKIFDDQNLFPVADLKGIQRNHFKEMKKEAIIVKTLSGVLQNVFDSHANVIVTPENFRLNVENIREGVTQKLRQVSLITSLKKYGLESEEQKIRNEMNRFSDVLNKNYIIQFDDDKSLYIAGNHIPVSFSVVTMSKALAMNTLARFLMLGYGSPNSAVVAERNLSGDDMELWYSDFKNFGVSVQAFDPRSQKSGYRSFNEASFFTYSGNGDSKMGFDESYELISFLFSAGLVGADLLRKGIEEIQKSDNDVFRSIPECGVLASQPSEIFANADIFGHQKVPRECLKKFWKKNAKTLFPNLPGMAQYIHSLNDADFNEYYSALEEGALGKSPEKYDTSDLRTLVAVSHYIESIYTSFDLDHDQVLQFHEIRPASSRFLEMILKIIVDKEKAPPWLAGQQLSQIVFEYLVIHGKEPASASDIASFWWKTWKNQTQLTANRMNVLRVFRVVRSASGS
ncbi:MAG: hypothetical protein ACK5P5_14825 [Pseudobdellovibrionaceae bacterium]